MFSIENAKEQADILTTYMHSVGKKVKHTHALEAVARMYGYPTWGAFLSAARGQTDSESQHVPGSAILKLHQHQAALTGTA